VCWKVDSDRIQLKKPARTFENYVLIDFLKGEIPSITLNDD